MEASKKSDNQMTSAAAFVEGGVQEACGDACSICLEDFSPSDPSTVTNCKHEFHLQCILEWCQRSSHCPMCWQSISLKDATSQELLEAVEQERKFRSNHRSRNATVFRHPGFGDSELHHLHMVAGEGELEEHIFQHLAAAMQRGHHIFRREGQSSRSSLQAHHPFFIFSAPHSSRAISPSSHLVEGESQSAAVSLGNAQVLPVPVSPADQADHHVVVRTGSSVAFTNQPRILSETRSFASHLSPGRQDTAGPSDFQSLSESLRSRFNAWSMRYKESISRNTRGWKERLFARSTSMADLGSEVQREVNAGIASVSRMVERLDSRENNNGAGHAPRSNDSRENNSKTSASCATSSASD